MVYVFSAAILALSLAGLALTHRRRVQKERQAAQREREISERLAATHHQLKALAEDGYRVVAPDQRGYSPGARPTEVADYAMGNLVADVIGMADELGFERFHLVGHDWGGAVAWVTSMRHPERLLSLTVVSTPHLAALSLARNDPASGQAQRSSYMKRFAEQGSEQDFLANDAAGLRAIFGGAGLSADEIQVYVDALGTQEAMRAALNWYSAMVSSSTGGLAPIPALAAGGRTDDLPTLYVWSTADPVFGREAAEATADFAAEPYRFEELEGIGHWIPEQAPELLNALLIEHLGAER
jgi:pimeloyl-ACP methyl ester carboxylesterase